MHISNKYYLLLLLLLPLLGGVIAYFIRWEKIGKTKFADAKFRDKFFIKQNLFSKMIPSLYLVAILFLVFSMLDLLGGKEKIKTQQHTNNIIFLLDVSNSMSTEDISENRLTQAKNIISNTLPKLSGSRVGVILFAGEARSIMPLTTDISAIENYVNSIETTSIKVQGTDFLEAMKVAVEKFQNTPKDARQVIIISDGEDNENMKQKTIDLAKEEGIQVATIGIGTEDGAPIPEYYYGQLMGYKKSNNLGETIISAMHPETLKDIAQETGGIYIDGNNLDGSINEIISFAKNQKNTFKINIESYNYDHYYQYLLGVSLILFFIIYLFNPKRDLNI